MDVRNHLRRMHTILQTHDGDSAAWIETLVKLHNTDEAAVYRALNSKRMWGGAGSIANEALADNPGMAAWEWQMQIREFRELMIELGQLLQSRGEAYPDISAWIMAFSNWNQSEI